MLPYQRFVLVLFLIQEYSVQITFRQQWNDHRLAFNDMDGESCLFHPPSVRLNSLQPQHWSPDAPCQVDRRARSNRALTTDVQGKNYHWRGTCKESAAFTSSSETSKCEGKGENPTSTGMKNANSQGGERGLYLLGEKYREFWCRCHREKDGEAEDIRCSRAGSCSLVLFFVCGNFTLR